MQNKINKFCKIHDCGENEIYEVEWQRASTANYVDSGYYDVFYYRIRITCRCAEKIVGGVMGISYEKGGMWVWFLHYVYDNNSNILIYNSHWHI